jgi:hypothetical protein
MTAPRRSNPMNMAIFLALRFPLLLLLCPSLSDSESELDGAGDGDWDD